MLNAGIQSSFRETTSYYQTLHNAVREFQQLINCREKVKLDMFSKIDNILLRQPAIVNLHRQKQQKIQEMSAQLSYQQRIIERYRENEVVLRRKLETLEGMNFRLLQSLCKLAGKPDPNNSPNTPQSVDQTSIMIPQPVAAPKQIYPQLINHCNKNMLAGSVSVFSFFVSKLKPSQMEIESRKERLNVVAKLKECMEKISGLEFQVSEACTSMIEKSKTLQETEGKYQKELEQLEKLNITKQKLDWAKFVDMFDFISEVYDSRVKVEHLDYLFWSECSTLMVRLKSIQPTNAQTIKLKKQLQEEFLQCKLLSQILQKSELDFTQYEDSVLRYKQITEDMEASGRLISFEGQEQNFIENLRQTVLHEKRLVNLLSAHFQEVNQKINSCRIIFAESILEMEEAVRKKDDDINKLKKEISSLQKKLQEKRLDIGDQLNSSNISGTKRLRSRRNESVAHSKPQKLLTLQSLVVDIKVAPMLETFSFTGEDSAKKQAENKEASVTNSFPNQLLHKNTGQFQVAFHNVINETEEHTPLDSYIKATKFIKAKIIEIEANQNLVRDALAQMVTLKMQLQDMEAKVPPAKFTDDQAFEDVSLVAVSSFRLLKREKEKFNPRHFNDPFGGDISPVLIEAQQKKATFSGLVDFSIDIKQEQAKERGDQKSEQKSQSKADLQQRNIETKFGSDLKRRNSVKVGEDKKISELARIQQQSKAVKNLTLKNAELEKQLESYKQNMKKNKQQIQLLRFEISQLKEQIKSHQMRLRDDFSHYIIVQPPASSINVQKAPNKSSAMLNPSVVQNPSASSSTFRMELTGIPQTQLELSKTNFDILVQERDRLLTQCSRLKVIQEKSSKNEAQTSILEDFSKEKKGKKAVEQLQEQNQKLKMELSQLQDLKIKTTEMEKLLKGSKKQLAQISEAYEDSKKSIDKLKEELMKDEGGRSADKPNNPNNPNISNSSVLDQAPHIVVHSPNTTPQKERINEVMQAARLQLAQQMDSVELPPIQQLHIQNMDASQMQRKFQQLIELKVKRQKQLNHIERMMGSLTQRLPAAHHRQEQEEKKCSSFKQQRQQPLRWMTPLQSMLRNNEEGLSALSHVSSEHIRKMRELERKAREQQDNYKGLINILQRKVARFKQSQSTYNLLRQQVRILGEDKSRLELEINQLHEKLEFISQDPTDQQARLQNVQQMRDQAQKQLAMISQRMEVNYQMSFKELEADRFQAESENKELKARLQNALNDIKEMRREKGEIQKEIEEMTERIKKMAQQNKLATEREEQAKAVTEKLRKELEGIRNSQQKKTEEVEKGKVIQQNQIQELQSKQQQIETLRKKVEIVIQEKRKYEQTRIITTQHRQQHPKVTLKEADPPLIPLSSIKTEFEPDPPFVPTSPIAPNANYQPKTPSAQQQQESKDMLMLKQALKHNKPMATNPDISMNIIAESALELQMEKSQQQKKQMIEKIQEQKAGLQNLHQELLKEKEKATKLEEKVKELEKRDGLEEVVAGLKVRIKDLENQIQQKNNRIKQLQMEIRSRPEPKHDESKLPQDSSNLQLKMLKEDINYYKKCIDTHITEKARQDCELKQLTSQFQELQAAYKERILREQAWIQKILNNEEFKPIDPKLNKDFLQYVFTIQQKVRKQEQQIKETLIEIEVDKLEQTEQIEKLRKTVTESLKSLELPPAQATKS